MIAFLITVGSRNNPLEILTLAESPANAMQNLTEAKVELPVLKLERLPYAVVTRNIGDSHAKLTRS